jgi:hypothetical protein
MVDDIVNMLGQDGADIGEIHQHPLIRNALCLDDIALNFCLKAVTVSVQMFAFRFMIGHPMPGIGFYESPYGGRHVSSSSSVNIMEAELMQ